nr:PREDICTED: cytochrome b-c1 complex subunit 10-like [Paralichthys olivaceus]
MRSTSSNQTRYFLRARVAARQAPGGNISDKMLSKVIGQKYVSIAKSWIPTLAIWGTAGGVALVHFTDWRLFLDYVPIINGKFKKDE